MLTFRVCNSKSQEQRMTLVACGWRHTIAVNTAGVLYTYGWSKYGQLGHGDYEDHLIPYKLEELSNQRVSQVLIYSILINFVSQITCFDQSWLWRFSDIKVQIY